MFEVVIHPAEYNYVKVFDPKLLYVVDIQVREISGPGLQGFMGKLVGRCTPVADMG